MTIDPLATDGEPVPTAPVAPSADALSEPSLKITLRRSDRLMRITAAIADAVTSEQVFEAVVDQVAATLGASSSGLWLVGADRETAALARSVGYTPETEARLRRLPIEGEQRVPVVDAIRERVPIWVGSQEELVRRYPHLSSMVTPGRSYAIACLPIVVQGRTLGAVGLTFDGTHGALDGDERDFLSLVVRYSGQALERLRLLDAERTSRERAEHARLRAELLYGLAQGVIGAEQVTEVFDAALDAIQLALGTDRSAILVYDDQGVMRFRAWRGLSDAYRAAVEGHSPWSRETRAPEPIFVPDAAADPSFAAFSALFRREEIGALGFVPLVAEGRLIGKFMVYHREPTDLGAQQLEMAQAIANHVAAAIARFSAVSELQRTVRFNELFTGILGHDLRNPLMAIMTAAQLAMTRDDSGKMVKPLSRILTSGNRMARMIDQLLDFTRVRLGSGVPLTPAPFDLVPVVRQVMEELEDANPEWSLVFENRGNTEGRWDSDRLSQVFSNLIANAVHHGIAAHGVQVQLDGTRDDAVRVTVHNMGCIPAARLPALFEPLSGSERRAERARGLGLGLFITREIVRAHGGTIDVCSDDASGTRFVVTLPREAGDARPWRGSPATQR